MTRSTTRPTCSLSVAALTLLASGCSELDADDRTTAPTSVESTGTQETENDTTASGLADEETSSDDSASSTEEEGDSGGESCQVSDLIGESQWDLLFLHKNDPECSGAVYTYAGFVDAAGSYPSFACEGGEETRRRELAAFLAQISHETTGGWATAPDGAHAWGLCFAEEVGCADGDCTQYCEPSVSAWPCALGQTYHGRGAMQLSWNYNYGQFSDAFGVDVLSEPDLVANDPELAIASALWFWMTPQMPKPSAHAVLVGKWEPTASDEMVGRLPGFGMTTNIINGGIECGKPTPPAVEDRVGFFTRYAELLGTTPGENLYCESMASY